MGVVFVAVLFAATLLVAPAYAADNVLISDLAGCPGESDPDCSVPPGGNVEAPKQISVTR